MYTMTKLSVRFGAVKDGDMYKGFEKTFPFECVPVEYLEGLWEGMLLITSPSNRPGITITLEIQPEE